MNGSNGEGTEKTPIDGAQDEWAQVNPIVQLYRDGPACVVEQRGGAYSLLSMNSAYQASLTTELLSGLAEVSIDEPVIHKANVRWNVVRLGGRAAPSRLVTCFGRLNEQNTSSTGPAPTPLQRPNRAEELLESLSKLEIPGVGRQQMLDHINLIRRTDWTKTPLGPMKDWNSVLLSSLGRALASPFPVLLAWGPEHTLIYNIPYLQNVHDKHPRIMGQPYQEAFSELWDFLCEAFADAKRGKAMHTHNAEIYLQRQGYLEECYFTWSLIPVFDESGTIAGIYIPNFDNTKAVIAERRIQLLREASQAFSIDTKPHVFFQRVARVATRFSRDLPLVVFYDCSAADEEREISDHSSEFLQVPSVAGSATHERIHHQRPGTPSEGHASTSTPSDDTVRSGLTYTFVRAAYTGREETSSVFPREIPPPDPDGTEPSIATHPNFLKALREVQRTRKQVILHKEELAPYVDDLDETALSDKLNAIAIIPVVTLDGNVRALCVVGLNPRKKYGDDYAVFLDLFRSQINHGVTSIRLINEELRRTTFFAALIKRKNEELHDLLEARTSALQTSEKKFVKMAEMSPSGIWTVDPTGHFTFVNEAWWRMTGLPRHLNPDDWPAVIHPEDLPSAHEWFGRALKSKETIHPYEFRWNPANGAGHEKWIWAQASPELDENGEIVALTGTLTDITEKKLVELHQVQRAEEAIQLRRAQESFIDMTSHELRNPLSAISLSSDATTDRLEALANAEAHTMLMDRYKAEVEETLSDMKIISHCCLHMTRLIDDVLLLSKLDNQFLVITPVPCRPADFISETLAIFKGELVSKDIAYELDILPSFVANKVDYVLTDPSRINQLVINILTNAIKFTAASKNRKITVKLDCSITKPTAAGLTIHQNKDAVKDDERAADPNSLYLLVSISDTGRGLTQEEMGHLFQRFRQANPKTHISYGGSGLGLHICKRITELLGGEIGVESTRGRGSTFSFYIPVKRCSALMAGSLAASPGFSAGPGASGSMASHATTHHPAALSTASSPADESANHFDKLSLLIVEDNLINQRLLDKQLTRVGCITQCANHGQEAIDLLKQSKWVRSDGPTIDCVLMDIEMPVMDGMTAIQILRKMEASGEVKGHIPVLAVTANARSEQLKDMLQSGFDGTISKPFKIPVIMDRVRGLLKQLRSQSVVKQAQ